MCSIGFLLSLKGPPESHSPNDTANNMKYSGGNGCTNKKIHKCISPILAKQRNFWPFTFSLCTFDKNDLQYSSIDCDQ